MSFVLRKPLVSDNKSVCSCLNKLMLCVTENWERSFVIRGPIAAYIKVSSYPVSFSNPAFPRHCGLPSAVCW